MCLLLPPLQVDESALQALTFVSHRYWGLSHNFLALLFGAPRPCLAVLFARAPAMNAPARVWGGAAWPICRAGSRHRCNTLRSHQLAGSMAHLPPPRLHLRPAVAEEWRHEPHGMEGQKLVWVDCDELMSYADK